MNITLHESEALFSQLEAEWDELLSSSRADGIFLTLEWQSTWWEAYHPGRLWVLLIRDDDTGRLMGIAPWFIDTLADTGLRVVRTVGCVDVTDYLEVIARQGYEKAVFEALAGFLAGQTSQFDEIRLCNVPQNSLTHTVMPEVFERQGFAVRVQLQEVCPVICLPGQWEDYVASLDKKNRHELRRKLRRAEGAVERVNWYIVGPGHDVSEELERFMSLMAASSPQKAAFLDDPQNQAFFRAIVPKLAARGWLQLAFLTVNGEAAAAYLNFDYNGHILVYNSGLNPNAYGHLSPGIVLLARLIEHAINQNRRVFDFLRGDEPYKYDMGGENTSVYQVFIAQAAA